MTEIIINASLGKCFIFILTMIKLPLWSMQIEFLSQMNRKLCCFSWACPLRVCKALALLCHFCPGSLLKGFCLSGKCSYQSRALLMFLALLFSPAVIRCKFHLSTQFARCRCSWCGINEPISLQLAATNTRKSLWPLLLIYIMRAGEAFVYSRSMFAGEIMKSFVVLALILCAFEVCLRSVSFHDD